MVALQGNDEKLDYWLACCVRGKQKLTQPIIDDDGFTYPPGLVVVARTWLWTYMLRRNGILASYYSNKCEIVEASKKTKSKRTFYYY